MINPFTPDYPLWSKFIAHLERHNMARWVLTDDYQPRPDHGCLGALTVCQAVRSCGSSKAV